MYRVSVVIPVYNRQASAERALRSALAQWVPAMEIIIVDDGSQPAFELPPDLRSRDDIRVIRHDDNRGQSAARNIGVSAAAAEWIAFLDSDDYWLPASLQPRLDLALREFNESRDPLVAYAAGFVINNKRTGKRDARIPRQSADPMDFASGCWFSPGSTGLLRKELFTLVGPFDPRLRRLEDLDWFLRLARLGGRLRVWNEIVVIVETGPKPNIAVLERAANRLLEKYVAQDSLQRLPAKVARRLQAFLNLERASIFAAQRKWACCAFYLALSVCQQPRTSLHLERFWCHVPLPLFA